VSDGYGEDWIITDEDYTRTACGLVVHVDDFPDHATLLDPCEDCDRLSQTEPRERMAEG
jgi:hypothetical protein